MLVPASHVRVDVVEDSGGDMSMGMDDIDTNMFASSTNGGGGGGDGSYNADDTYEIPITGFAPGSPSVPSFKNGPPTAPRTEGEGGVMGFAEAEYLVPVLLGPKPTHSSDSGGGVPRNAQESSAESEHNGYINQAVVDKHVAAQKATATTGDGAVGGGQPEEDDPAVGCVGIGIHAEFPLASCMSLGVVISCGSDARRLTMWTGTTANTHTHMHTVHAHARTRGRTDVQTHTRTHASASSMRLRICGFAGILWCVG